MLETIIYFQGKCSQVYEKGHVMFLHQMPNMYAKHGKCICNDKNQRELLLMDGHVRTSFY